MTTRPAPVPVDLDGVETTMLMPLWARAQETRSAAPLVRDEKAVEIVERLDYDFSVFGTDWKNEVVMRATIAVGTELLDAAVRDFLARHPGGVVVNLGAGLDARFERVDDGRVRWFDLDLPRAIAFRRRFFAETDRRRFLARSFLDLAWIDEIAAEGAPVLLVAEGLLVYFPEAEVRGFLTGVAARLPGAEALVACVDPTLAFVMNLQAWTRRLEAPFKWGVWDGRDLERLGPGIRFLAQWHHFDHHPERFGPFFFAKLVPALRSWMKIVHLRLGERG
jgi:O-methyltransferase involved in polyketide biosynthesis